MRTSKRYTKFCALIGSAAVVAAVTTSPVGALMRSTGQVHAATSSTAERGLSAAMTRFHAVSAEAAKARAPHVVMHQSWTYDVNTTTDATLSGSAPAHACEDTGNSSQCSYRAALQAASDDMTASGVDGQVSDTIVLPAGDYVLSHANGGISFEPDYGGNLVIRGAGDTSTIIDGAGGFEGELLGLNVSDNSVSISGVQFKGGVEDYDAGAIWIDPDNYVDISHCSFVDDTAGYQGGAISEDGAGTLIVSDSTFSDDTAEEGGGAIQTGAYSSSSGLAVLSGDTFTDDGSLGSGTDYDGGAVDAAGPLSVDHSVFNGNDTLEGGGAIYNTATTVLASDTFSDNTSTESGGAIFIEGDVSVTNSTLSHNSADSAAGAVAFEGSGYFDGDAFSNNEAVEEGGDIAYLGQAVIENSTSQDSSADGEGGSIASVSTANLTAVGDTFTGDVTSDSSTTGGGGAIFSPGTVSLSHDNFKDCQVKDDGLGGAVFLDDAISTIDQSSFDDNSAAYGGGGLYAIDGEATLSNDTFDANTSDWGGAVNGQGEIQLTIESSTINANTSNTYEGGGISVDADSSTAALTLLDSTVSNNRAVVTGATPYGGGLSLTGGVQSYLSNDTIAGNEALYGGAIYELGSSSAEIYSSTISNNEATESVVGAGGAYVNNSSLTSTSTIWSDNEGANCYGQSDTILSGGYNLDSDGTCDFSAVGDVANSSANLGALQYNGGPTETMAPVSPSPAIGGGGAACPEYDQRGDGVPSAATCDIGAVFVEETTSTLAFSSTTVTVGHEQAVTFTVTVTPQLKGTSPTGTADVYAMGTLVCQAKLKAVSGSHTNSSTGTCTTTPTKLKKGTPGLFADYLGSGTFASSDSAVKELKVVA